MLENPINLLVEQLGPSVMTRDLASLFHGFGTGNLLRVYQPCLSNRRRDPRKTEP